LSPDHDADAPVLIAYDGSDQAKEAIDQAGLQLRTPRKAIVLSVYQPLSAIPFWGTPYGKVPPELLEAAEEQANKAAAEGAAAAKEAGFDAEPAVIEATPIWEGIVNTAQERGASMIAMGSHGRSGASYVALGSVATSVAHHAKVPVLICRGK